LIVWGRGKALSLIAESRRIVKSNRFVSWLLLAVVIGFITGPPIGVIAKYLRSGYWIRYDNFSTFANMLWTTGRFGAAMCIAFLMIFFLPAKYLSPVLKQYPRVVSLPLQIIAIFIGGILMFTLRSYLLWYFMSVPAPNASQLKTTLFLSIGFSALLALLIGAFAKLRSEVKRAEAMLYESKIKEQMYAERMATAQLRALQAQINPHFFFNTLSSINALLNTDTNAAKQMLIRLAGIQRYVFSCYDRKSDSLRDEIKFVEDYLGIEAVRFRDRLKVIIEAPESYDSVTVPGLILQPIVENAVKHGIARNLAGGYIRLSVKQEGAQIVINVRNTAEHPLELPREGLFVEGHALKNVFDRLNAVYGSDHRFEIRNVDDCVSVELTLPIEPRGKNVQSIDSR
jgi:sensor histidine kinase YesM